MPWESDLRGQPKLAKLPAGITEETCLSSDLTATAHARYVRPGAGLPQGGGHCPRGRHLQGFGVHLYGPSASLPRRSRLFCWAPRTWSSGGVEAVHNFFLAYSFLHERFAQITQRY